MVKGAKIFFNLCGLKKGDNAFFLYRRATAVAIAAEGAHVAILDRTETALQDTAKAVGKAGGKVLTIACDVSKPEKVEAAAAPHGREFGRLYIAFNNAGVENKAPVAEIALEKLDRILDINLRGYFVCNEARTGADGAAGRRRGRQHVIGSGHPWHRRWLCPFRLQACNHRLTKSAALDYAKSNIRVETLMMDRFTGGDI